VLLLTQWLLLTSSKPHANAAYSVGGYGVIRKAPAQKAGAFPYPTRAKLFDRLQERSYWEELLSRDKYFQVSCKCNWSFMPLVNAGKLELVQLPSVPTGHTRGDTMNSCALRCPARGTLSTLVAVKYRYSDNFLRIARCLSTTEKPHVLTSIAHRWHLLARVSIRLLCRESILAACSPEITHDMTLHQVPNTISEHKLMSATR
jgi:hypothetical protein